jgi:hypothetical protein
MPPRDTNDPKHWRDRAANMHAMALTVKVPETVILMTDLADDYEKPADRAAMWGDKEESPPNGNARWRAVRNKAAVSTLYLREGRNRHCAHVRLFPSIKL